MRYLPLLMMLFPALAIGQVQGDSVRLSLNDGQQLDGRLMSLDSVSVDVQRQSDEYTFSLGRLDRVEVWRRKSQFREIGLRGVLSAFGMWMASREFLWGKSTSPVTGSATFDVALGAAAGAALGVALFRESRGEWKEIRVRAFPSGVGLALAVSWP